MLVDDVQRIAISDAGLRVSVTTQFEELVVKPCALQLSAVGKTVLQMKDE